MEKTDNREKTTRPRLFEYRDGKIYFDQGIERRILFYLTLALMIAGLVYMVLEI